MKKKDKSLRKDVFAYAKEKYGTEPEYLWAKFPDYAVIRHDDNNKWYGIIMNLSYEKLDKDKSGMVDVLNIKLNDLLLRDMLIKEKGYYPGYHISRGNWVSVVLDGTVAIEAITHLIDESFNATASARKKQIVRPPKEWLIPSNPKYYDIIHAFDETDEITWKQGAGIKKGDTVFMYVGLPVSAVLYKCKVTETDMPYEYHSKELTIKALMKIKLLKRYTPEQFTFEILKSEYGIYAIRGPRGIPNSLSCALNDAN